MLNEADLVTDEWRTNAENPVVVRITHRPSGWTGQAVDSSPLKARKLARARLEVALLVAGVEL